MAKVRKGDFITAELLSRIPDPFSIPTLRAGGGLSSRQNPDGSSQVWNDAPTSGVMAGKTTSTITANSTSGGNITFGSGTVELYVKDQATGYYVDSGASYTCDNLSTTTGGIASGTWVWWMFQPDGTPSIIAVDCGN